MPSTEILTLPLNDLLDSGEGEREKYSLEAEINFPDEKFDVVSPLKFKVTLMRLKEGIHTLIEDFHCDVLLPCDRCSKSSKAAVEINKTERIFYLNRADAETEDPFDIYLIDRENSEIDLTELLRHEIILHFPDIVLCSSSCKGICSKCGKELNLSTCSCKKEKTSNGENRTHKPLSKLKELFEDSQNFQ